MQTIHTCRFHLVSPAAMRHRRRNFSEWLVLCTLSLVIMIQWKMTKFKRSMHCPEGAHVWLIHDCSDCSYSWTVFRVPYRPQKNPLYLLHQGRGHWLQSHCFLGFVKLFLPSSPNWSLQPSIAKAQWPNNTQASFRRSVNRPKATLNFWLLWNYKEANHIKHISKRKQRVRTCNRHLNVAPFSTKKKHKTVSASLDSVFPSQKPNKG